MKKAAIIALLTLVCGDIFSQGVALQEVTFAEAMRQAQEQDKLIFADFYAVWCGPCRAMAERLETESAAAEYFGPRFICVKFDMERGEGKELTEKHGFTSIPTYAVFDSEGNELHRIAGAAPLDEFIQRVEAGLVHGNPAGTLSAEFDSGRMSKKRMLEYVELLAVQGNADRCAEVGNRLLGQLSTTEKLSAEYWPLLADRYINPAESEHFVFLLANRETLVRAVGEGAVNNKIQQNLYVINSHLAGHCTEADLPHFDRIVGLIGKYDFPGRETALLRARVARMVTTRDADGLLSFFEENLPRIEPQMLMSLSSPLGFIAGTDDLATLQRASALGRRFVEAAPEGFARRRIAQNFADFDKKLSDGVWWEDLALEEAQARARDKNLLIFVDCYTSWCGPCKTMSEKVFTQKAAGDFFNSRFVNVKFDMEKGEGVAIKERYGVDAYPTFLILACDGREINRIIGAMSLDKFIDKTERAIAPDNDFDVLEKEYTGGAMSDGRMKTFVLMLADAYDDRTRGVAEELFSRLPADAKTSSEYWPLLSNPRIIPGTSEHFLFMLDNLDTIKRNVGEELVENHLKAFRRNFNNYFELSERYAAGDRNKEMLLEYVRLLSAFYKGRAYEVRDELFNRLSDRERRDPHFWDLYNLAGLEGPDNPAFDYLLKNRKRFNRTIGQDKVDKLIDRVQRDGTI